MAKPFAPQLHEGANRVRSPLRFPKYPNQKKRRGWDLNPRYKLYTDFRDPHLKPLGHLSFYFILKPTTSNPYDENVFLRKHNLQQYFHFQSAYIYI